jgi:hypothetical protein
MSFVGRLNIREKLAFLSNARLDYISG